MRKKKKRKTILKNKCEAAKSAILSFGDPFGEGGGRGGGEGGRNRLPGWS